MKDEKTMEFAPEEVVVTPEEVVETKETKRKVESTGEKAKKAAAARAEAGITAANTPKKELDPLRLRGKKYRDAFKKVDRTIIFSVEEAIQLVKDSNYAKFDAAVELHAKVKSAGVRGTVVLPHGNGKKVRVAVADEATIEAISKGELAFDVLLATPAQMPKLAKYAKVLGPKGLMPSPKAGTVTDNIESTKKEIEGGRSEYRADKGSVVHLSIGRVSFKNDQLIENFNAITGVLAASRIMSMSLSSTMGPGVKVKIA